jgi:signal transduction histidine kinase
MTKQMQGVSHSPSLGGERHPDHAWERWAPVWHGAFYFVLGLASTLALADEVSSWSRRGVILAPALGLAAWYWFWAVRRRVWNLPLSQVATYLAVAAVLWVVLLLLHGAFLIVAFSAYAQVLGFLPTTRSAVLGAVALTLLVLVMQGIKMEPLTPAAFLFAVASAGAAILLSLWVSAIIRQSRERHRLVEELEATRAELAAAERLAGKLEERERLASEIHDTLAQGFTSIVTLLEATDAQLEQGEVTARRFVGQALDSARDNLAEARRLVWALQPEALVGSSLVEALGRLVVRLQDETGVDARFVVTGTPQVLSTQTVIALLRAAQEGSANIRKHAQATEVVLTLSYVGDQVILDLRDDGCGFDPTALDGHKGELGGGFGLRGLGARLAALGGRLDVESTRGEGTVLVAHLPLVVGSERTGRERL